MATYFDRFFSEKGIDLEEEFEVEGPSGINYMSYGVVVEHIKIAPAHEKAKIKKMLIYIDFKNGDVKHFLRHLAQAIAI